MKRTAHRLSRRSFLAGGGGAAAVAGAGDPTPRPNLVLICTDGWRGQALPFAGDTNVRAPNLARLAREGFHARRAYTTFAQCCPSRAAMLTGRFPHAAGITRNHSFLALDQPSFGQTLRDAGYRTGFVGKWHLDGGRGQPTNYVPPDRRRGFDFWAAYDIAHRHFAAEYFGDTPEPVRAEGLEAAILTDLALGFLREKRPAGQPFCLYLSLVPPHSPFTPPPGHGPLRAPLGLRPNVTAEAARKFAQRDLAGYYGLCSAADEQIGRLLAELDRQNLRRDTIVAFTSDHGDMQGSQGLEGFNVPFEESVRVPLLIRYPRRVRAGSSAAAPVSNVDLAPTLLGLCGVAAPESMQGRNLAPVLAQSDRRLPADEPVFAEGEIGEAAEWRMIVRGRYKLVAAGPEFRPTHLFDLRGDPYEMTNRVDAPGERGRREELLGLLRAWWAATTSGAWRPTRSSGRRSPRPPA